MIHRKDTVSQFATDTIGIGVFENNAYEDPDNEQVEITIVRDSDGMVIYDHDTATRDGVGLYSYQISTPITATKGDYTATWEYTLDGNARQFVYQFVITDPQPFFDSLNANQKQLVENVYQKVSDGFDSTIGGPYLWELPQSAFGFETIAKLMVVDAMNYLNFSKPKAFVPPYQVGANVSNPIPEGWYGLVEKATAYELYKHLSRSYLEIPDPVGVDVAHLDRTQYSKKWMEVAAYERDELDSQVHMLKRAMQFGVKSRSMLVAGGIFPISYLNPARPRWPYVLTRFY